MLCIDTDWVYLLAFTCSYPSLSFFRNNTRRKALASASKQGNMSAWKIDARVGGGVSFLFSEAFCSCKRETGKNASRWQPNGKPRTQAQASAGAAAH